MTLPDPSLETEPGGQRDQLQDRLPPTERNQDPERTAVSHGLTTDVSRPLTSEEREAAERDIPRGERVYAPASERVPKAPVPGHRDFVEHPDESTPERRAAPSMPGGRQSMAWSQASSTRVGLAIGGGWTVVAAVAIGTWLILRWRREQNRPINRVRRQARRATSEIRHRLAAADEMQPGLSGGSLAALVPLGLVVWRRMSTARRYDGTLQRVAEPITETDWQHRLLALRERWTPRRLELERFSITRH